MNPEPGETDSEPLDSLTPETCFHIRRCREAAEVDFMIQANGSLVPSFHKGKALAMKKQNGALYKSAEGRK